MNGERHSCDEEFGPALRHGTSTNEPFGSVGTLHEAFRLGLEAKKNAPEVNSGAFSAWGRSELQRQNCVPSRRPARPGPVIKSQRMRPNV